MRLIRMQRLGEISNQGTIMEWLKKEGEKVKEGEPIVMIETEKLETELEAPATGILYKILAYEGTTVSFGEVIGVIMEDDDKPRDIEAIIQKLLSFEGKEEKLVVQKEGKARERIEASPAAKKLASEHDTDLSLVKGSGPEGRIVKEDVKNFVEKMEVALKKETILPLVGFRKVMAERMAYSVRAYAPVTSTWEVDVTDLLESRRKLKPTWEKEGIRVTITAFLVKAVVQTLKENPIFNSTLKEGNIILKHYYNIGIATAIEGDSFLEDKLIVPVIHDMDKKSLVEIAKSIEEIAKKAQTNSFTANDLTGGTFTISNVGARANVSIFTPIINPPESAILGVGSITKKPVIRNGTVVVRLIMPLILTYDHRIILPTNSAKFRRRLKELLENPQTLID